jgi:hypothetical protein
MTPHHPLEVLNFGRRLFQEQKDSDHFTHDDIQKAFEQNFEPLPDEEYDERRYEEAIIATFSPIESCIAELIAASDPLKEELIPDIEEQARRFIIGDDTKIEYTPRTRIISRLISIGNYTIKYGAILCAPNESVFNIIELLVEQAAEDTASIEETIDRIEKILTPFRDRIEEIDNFLKNLERLRNAGEDKNRTIEELRRQINLILETLSAIMAPASFINKKSQEFAKRYPLGQVQRS